MARFSAVPSQVVGALAFECRLYLPQDSTQDPKEIAFCEKGRTEASTTLSARVLPASSYRVVLLLGKKRKKQDNRREGWEDGTPPPHRDFKERSSRRSGAHLNSFG